MGERVREWVNLIVHTIAGLAGDGFGSLRRSGQVGGWKWRNREPVNRLNRSAFNRWTSTMKVQYQKCEHDGGLRAC